MELEDRDSRVKTAYEAALERMSPVSRRCEEEADRASFESEESTYDESIFVREDHVSIQPKSLDRQRQRVPAAPQVQRKSIYEHPAVDSKSEAAKRGELEDLTEMPLLPSPEPERYEVACHWGGPVYDYGGYARMNRTYIFGLKQRGALVRARPVDSVVDVNGRTEQFIRSMESVEVPSRYPRIYGMTVPDIIAHGGPKILYTMMETSHRVHSEYADRLNLSDEIWVPCTWNREVFQNSGVLADIRVMPLGVDTELFCPGAEPLTFNAGSFRFLSVFGWSYRKGFDVLIQAYLEEFSSKEDVSLIISSKFVGQVSKKSHDRILSDFQYVKSLVAKSESDMPHVALHSARTPDREMPRLYAAGHCFVLPSRGEGQGLPFCCLPGTPTRLASGRWNAIESIAKGDCLRALSAEKVTVVATMSRRHSGKISVVKTVGLPAFRCTPEHPLMAVRRRNRFDIGNDLSGRIEEIAAADLKKGDFLVYPIDSDGSSAEILDLSEHEAYESKYSNRSVRGSESWAELGERIGEKKHAVARAVREDGHISDKIRRRILKKLSAIGHEYSSDAYSLPESFELTPDVLEFFGLYIAKGSFTNGIANLASHVDELAIRELESRVVEGVFLRTAYEKIRGKRAEICFSLTGGQKFFGEFGAGAAQKHIPEFLWRCGPSGLIPLLHGIFTGDGCIAPRGMSLSSSSFELMLQVRSALLSLGVICSIHESLTRPGQYALLVYGAHGNKLRKLFGASPVFEEKEIRRTYQWISGNFLYSIVRSVGEEEYCGPVYNLDTDGDSTYIGAGVAMHNCEAGACELPVIASDHGGQRDFLDDDVAYLVQPDGYFTSKREDPPFRNLAWISHFYENQQFPHFGRPAIDQLRSHMRYVFENYSEAKKKAVRLRKRLVEHFDWSICIENVYQRLKNICRSCDFS